MASYSSGTPTDTFGKCLKAFRKAQKVKQQVLASVLSCKFQSVSNWESGRSLPQENKLAKIAEYLKLSAIDARHLVMLHTLEQVFPKTPKFSEVERRAWEYRQKTLRLQRFGMDLPLYRRTDIHDPRKRPYLRKPNRPGEPAWLTRTDMMQSDLWTFAFLIEDEAMAPLYHPGDRLLCGLMPKADPGDVVVTCVKNETTCRILEKKNGIFLFRAANRRTRPIRARRSDVQWYYKVVALLRMEAEAK